MATKISVKGLLKDFTGAQVVESTVNNDKPLAIQRVWITVPGWKDQFSDKAYPDKIWEFQIIGQESITKHGVNANFQLGDKVIITAWLDCNNPVKDGKMSYIYNANVHEIQKF